ncbi:hypothetical protein ABZ468_24905 [Streptomyces sp. NPDC005708]|uniref:hypothetical protein n=1 Tax=Streptomyces sp. NPDC005708 TaxID=3154564 RepID=UPI0033E46E57
MAATGSGQGIRRSLFNLRIPLHAAVAGAVTLPVADAINPGRNYWDVIGIMILLIGTNTTYERLRKAGNRIVGTAAVVVGLSVAVACLPACLPACLQQRYALMAAGLVIALVQVYGLAVPYADLNRLLAERLLDNALGMLVATAYGALIFLLSMRRIARETVHSYLAATEDLVAQITERWHDRDAPVRPRGAARAVEAALHQMKSVHQPLIRTPRGTARTLDTRLGLLSTAARHCRSLTAMADTGVVLPPGMRTGLGHVADVLISSLRALDRQITTNAVDGTWVRVVPMISELRSALPAPTDTGATLAHATLRELAALDETLAAFAHEKGLHVNGESTVPAHRRSGPPASSTAPRHARHPRLPRTPRVRQCR